MKKKSIIIPVICLVLSLAAMLTMTVFSTPVMYMYSVSKNTIANETDELAAFRETYRITETVMKLDPNYLNSYISALFCFDCERIGDSEYLEICKDYNRKSLEYAEMLVAAAKKSNGQNLFYSISTDEHEYQVASATANYVNALWCAGKKDEAKKVLEDYIYSLTKDNISCVYAFEFGAPTFENFETSDKDADRQWIRNLKNYIIELHNNSIEYKRSTGDYYPVEINRWEIDENGRIRQIYEEAEE